MVRLNGRPERLPLLLATWLVLAWLLLQFSVAHAQDAGEPLGSIPVDGQVVDQIPDIVRIVFGAPVEPVGPGIRVLDADRNQVDLGDGGSGPSPAVVQASLPDTLAVGSYLVEWHVQLLDGQEREGTVTFSVPQGVGVATGSGGPGSTGLLIALAAGVIAAVVAFVALRGRVAEETD
jgi:methionine-rich copper-binding protein CopC